MQKERRFYMSAHLAREELRRRQASGGRERIEAWWGTYGVTIPPFPRADDLAVFARQVAHVRFEDILFNEIARANGYTPVWLEHTADVFSSESSYKRSLLHPKFCVGRGRGGPITRKRRLVEDMTPWFGKPLRDILMTDGEPLVAFHRRRFEEFFPGGTYLDCGDYLRTLGSRASDYYHLYLGWFAAHSVLFDEYHASESGDGVKPKPFVERVFEPAWERVREETGLTPLIVSVPWYEGLDLHPEKKDWESYGIIRHS